MLDCTGLTQLATVGDYCLLDCTSLAALNWAGVTDKFLVFADGAATGADVKPQSGQ
mgnify:CR=1